MVGARRVEGGGSRFIHKVRFAGIIGAIGARLASSGSNSRTQNTI